MAATALTPAILYTSRGTTKVYWVPTIANPSSPTAVELNAGTDISAHIVDADGWSFQPDLISVPSMATRVDAKIAGVINLDDSSLTMHASKNGVDSSVLLPQDAVGNIVIFPGGLVPGYKMDVWPCTIAANALQMSVQGSDANTRLVTFSPSTVPVFNVTVPAGL